MLAIEQQLNYSSSEGLAMPSAVYVNSNEDIFVAERISTCFFDLPIFLLIKSVRLRFDQ